MSRPMPSPRGTNRAGLFLKGPVQAAYDAAIADDPDRASSLKAVFAALAEKGILSDDEVAKAKVALGIDDDGDQPDSDMASDRAIRSRAHDQYLQGKLTTADYNNMVTNPAAYRPRTAAEEAGFASRYPNAARIK